MAIQVNEIIIRATVSEGGEAQQGHHSRKKSDDPTGKDEIIAECVEQVMEILNREIKR
ncbi:MAG TPA: DUF5908 family protein [Bacteroidia bacterium]|nr:DUF5908 family protein [Bacteroidia bacterium]